jgi:hypothetical protein
MSPPLHHAANKFRVQAGVKLEHGMKLEPSAKLEAGIKIEPDIKTEPSSGYAPMLPPGEWRVWNNMPPVYCRPEDEGWAGLASRWLSPRGRPASSASMTTTAYTGAPSTSTAGVVRASSS